MTFKEVLSMVTGARFTEGLNPTADVALFLDFLQNLESLEKQKIRNTYDVVIDSQTYSLPYNYIIGKLSSLGDLPVDLGTLKSLTHSIKRKARMDLLQLVVAELRSQAAAEGDFSALSD